jgi:hypothetical protein
MLDPADKRRYARHLLLADVGEAGQARLLAARVQLEPSADPGAAEVAREYLARAGVQVGETGALVSLPSREAVSALAGSAFLHEAAAALAGAFAAVEAIKHTLGLGHAGKLEGFSLSPKGPA